MLIANEYDRPVRPSLTSEKYDRAAGGWSAGYVVMLLGVTYRKQIASAKLFSIGQVC